MSEAAEDVHQLDADAFWEQARSFEFWFGAVQGYLAGQTYGRRPDTPDRELSASDRDRLVGVLCNYCVAETAALEGAGGLIRIAPNRAAKIFLSTQTVDEGRHLEVLTQRLRELGVRDPDAEIEKRATPTLRRFKRQLLDFVGGGDWDAAIFAQNVILEAMEFAVFHRHAQDADPRTREILQGIVKDERRHIGFGENELGRRARRSPELRRRLKRVRRELDPLVLSSFEEAMQGIGAPRDRAADISRHYLQAVTRLGV